MINSIRETRQRGPDPPSAANPKRPFIRISGPLSLTMEGVAS